LQTWHGAPIKKLYGDISRRNTPLSYRRIMHHETKMWDMLLAPSGSSVQNLRTGLSYGGPVQVHFSPRNSRLIKSLRRRDAIRKSIGVTSQQTAVLYAPTWREWHKSESQQLWLNHLDVRAISEESNVKLLLRGHHVSNFKNIETGTATDVSWHPHIEDLLAAADLLITDYSSVAYDFKETGRQILYFAPDLEEYELERGLYRDSMDELNIHFIRSMEELSAKLVEAIPQTNFEGTLTNDFDHDLSGIVNIIKANVAAKPTGSRNMK
ncbi:hypothetical protein CO267_18245, partial [Acinetobacter baumannii]